MTEQKLTRKNQVFIEEYLVCWNASEAARQANYKHPTVQGPRLLGKVVIQERIRERMREMAMTSDETIKRITEQASANISDFVDLIEKGGRLELAGINWEEVKRRGHLVKSITPTQFGIKLELHDAQTALLAMAKRHKLLIARPEATLDVVEMTLEQWQELQKQRREQTNQTMTELEGSDG
mgnify:CR=1 FL=1